MNHISLLIEGSYLVSTNGNVYACLFGKSKGMSPGSMSVIIVLLVSLVLFGKQVLRQYQTNLEGNHKIVPKEALELH